MAYRRLRNTTGGSEMACAACGGRGWDRRWAVAGIGVARILNLFLRIVNAIRQCYRQSGKTSLKIATARRYGQAPIPPSLQQLRRGHALVASQEIQIAKDLSAQFGVGVASHYYGVRLESARAASRSLPPTLAANGFLTVRAALAEDRGVLPHIEGITHALALRRDPNLKALKEHLGHMNVALQNGRPDDLLRARLEIMKARKVLQRKRRWERALTWLTYLSVPVGVAEALVAGLPVASTTVSVLGASGAAYMQRMQKSNEWVLFGL